MNRLTKGQKQTTKRIRYANLKTFFNFAISTFDIKFNNPCDTPAVKKAGKLVGVNLNSHDLRRHAASYASRAGVPIEIVSKIILRHSNLAITQRYLGKISDVEALRWIENLHG